MRFVAVLGLSIASLATLVGCPKKEEPPPAPGTPSSSVSVAPKPSGWVSPPVSAAKTAAPPPIDDWQQVKVKNAKLSVKVPKGAIVSEDKAGADEAFAGSWFRVKMPSGYDLLFAENKGKDPVDIVAEKRRYRLDSEKKIALVYEADDAVVVNRSEDPPAGKYCEVTACGRIEGRPICASHAGALRAGQEIRKLTEVECLAVVAIARSITAL
jgi:hypothetical protein